MVSALIFWTVTWLSVTFLIKLDHEISTTATSHVPCSCIVSGSNVVKCSRELSGTTAFCRCCFEFGFVRSNVFGFKTSNLALIKFAFSQLLISVFEQVRGRVQCFVSHNFKDVFGESHSVVATMKQVKFSPDSNVLSNFKPGFLHGIGILQGNKKRFVRPLHLLGAILEIQLTRKFITLTEICKLAIKTSVLFSWRYWKMIDFSERIFRSANADVVSLFVGYKSMVAFLQNDASYPANSQPLSIIFFRLPGHSSGTSGCTTKKWLHIG